jgi:hypothetical protein
MTPLNYQTEVSASCSPEDVDFTAATSLIGGRDVVEEFLACGLWPLDEQFSFEVDGKESLLSKVIVLMHHITVSIGERESEAEFLSHIEKAVNELVGRYNFAEHTAY